MQTFLRRNVCESHTGKTLTVYIPTIFPKSHRRKHSLGVLGRKIIASWKEERKDILKDRNS